jgi:hypothetical protein
MIAAEAQAVHDQRQRGDPEHDRVGCWCCCLDCDFDYDTVTGKEEADGTRLHRAA